MTEMITERAGKFDIDEIKLMKVIRRLEDVEWQLKHDMRTAIYAKDIRAGVNALEDLAHAVRRANNEIHKP